VAVHKKGDRSWTALLATLPGLVLIAAVLALAVSGLVVAHTLRAAGRGRLSHVAGILVVNLGSVALAVAGAEALVRAFAVDTPAGPRFAETLLLPRSWSAVAAQNRAILARASAQGSYLVSDPDLGWTVGASRQSGDYNRDLVRYLAPQVAHRAPEHDRIYLSSVEGLRSPRPGMTLGARAVRHRVALVGDSFTFGLEVPYEDTWGHRLELALGPDVQVLNFGVDGYGLDQAYLRYRRDVRPWRPDVVVLGVINDDLRRSLCIYGFLCFGPLAQIPFAKPRFVARDDRLAPLNLPLPAPASIFAKGSITDLPFVEHDRAFDPVEWEWHAYHHAASVRFLLSRFRRWSGPRPSVTDEALRAINVRILLAFARLARDEGSQAIVMFLPSRSDFAPEPVRPASMARAVLDETRIPYLDMTDCVSRVGPDDRFVALHYSPASNAAVAACLASAIRADGRLGTTTGKTKDATSRP
jgi:hypothetical protein